MKTPWKAASVSFAKGAEGTVDFFTTNLGPRAESIWLNVEKPILNQKGLDIVTHTIGH